MIVYQSRIVREDLRSNPTVLYVFGDNLARSGMGGQAGEMRGMPNAVGVATKKAPGNRDGDFFTDDEYQENISWMRGDFDRAWNAAHDRCRIVVIPMDGIGTGLSAMPTKCPRTFAWMCGLRLGLGGLSERTGAYEGVSS